jgi:hypothetical protein
MYCNFSVISLIEGVTFLSLTVVYAGGSKSSQSTSQEG